MKAYLAKEAPTCGYWIFWPMLPSAPCTSSCWRQISASQMKVEFILSCLITEFLGHLIPAVFEGFTECDDLRSIWEYVVAGSMSTPPPLPRSPPPTVRNKTGVITKIRFETYFGSAFDAFRDRVGGWLNSESQVRLHRFLAPALRSDLVAQLALKVENQKAAKADKASVVGMAFSLLTQSFATVPTCPMPGEHLVRHWQQHR